MSNDARDGAAGDAEGTPQRMKGSLRDALAAASVSSGKPVPEKPAPEKPMVEKPVPEKREARASAPAAAAQARPDHVHIEPDSVATRVLRGPPRRGAAGEGAPLTQRLRGKIDVKRVDFHQDPVVGWLVVVGGPGLGAFRPIFEGNNTIGRNATQRIPIDFGDDAISGDEQAYIRYDSVDRKFLLVPNMAKTNIVAVNDQKPTAAVPLVAMDLITMGRTQLCFVPFCGGEFDWAELNELKS